MAAGYLARNTAAPAGVRHEDAVSPGQGQISRQRGAFVAAFFLYNLNQENLAPFDDLLDLVFAHMACWPALFHLVDVVATDGFDGFAFAVLTICRVVAIIRFLALSRFVFGKQLLPVGNRDLVVIWVDLAESEETVPVSTVIDERRLKRGFDPCYFGEIDVAFELLSGSRFDVEFIESVSIEDRDPGSLPDARNLLTFFLVAI